MIQQFRNLNFLNIFILLILTFVLRIGMYVFMPAEINTGFLESGTRLLLSNSKQTMFSPAANISIAALVVFVQALLFNRIINVYNIIGRSTFLPGLSFVLVSSVFTPFLFLSPPLLCNFFLIYLLYRILESIKNSDLISTMFDLGMVSAIGTIFYLPFAFVILILWIALVIFRAFNWREWFAVLLGYLTIVFFMAVYYYWNNKLDDFYEIWSSLATAFPVFIRIKLLDYTVLFPIIVALIIGFYQLRENFYKSYIQIRKTFQLLFFVFLIAALSFYTRRDYRINHFLLCVIPIASLLAYYFLHAKKRWFYESLFLVIAGFIIYFQFV